MVNANDKSASITDSPPILSLDRKYVYQTPTGTISSTSLTVRQLCRVFSPPSSSINSSTAAGDNDDDVGMVLPPPPSRFSTETQLIALLPDGVTYDPTGWKPARDIFILRHAASIFYYCLRKPLPPALLPPLPPTMMMMKVIMVLPEDLYRVDN